MIAFLRALLEHVAQRVDAGSANEEAERELAGRDCTHFSSLQRDSFDARPRLVTETSFRCARLRLVYRGFRETG